MILLSINVPYKDMNEIAGSCISNSEVSLNLEHLAGNPKMGMRDRRDVRTSIYCFCLHLLNRKKVHSIQQQICGSGRHTIRVIYVATSFSLTHPKVMTETTTNVAVKYWSVFYFVCISTANIWQPRKTCFKGGFKQH